MRRLRRPAGKRESVFKSHTAGITYYVARRLNEIDRVAPPSRHCPVESEKVGTTTYDRL